MLETPFFGPQRASGKRRDLLLSFRRSLAKGGDLASMEQAQCGIDDFNRKKFRHVFFFQGLGAPDTLALRFADGDSRRERHLPCDGGWVHRLRPRSRRARKDNRGLLSQR